jgi:cell shape-determining protein MreD
MAMNRLRAVLLLGAAFLAVFAQAACQGLRQALGAQVDLLPALMVCAAMDAGLVTVALLALCGGLWLDSLSANPLGVSILPLFAVGLAVFAGRELLLRDQVFAQAVLGLGASAAVPVLTLVVLLSTGHKPLLGWGSLWQWAVVSAGGAAATPVCFIVLDWLHARLAHGRAHESSFRLDREMRRGR